ncbi:GNAT family N-acetyltransferase [Reichenbachiella versicolor]|uniref:GNAT family N-acetyltransferase n=1 Tax=Reichenbachiella versicolor TaxID=1821036 RepID=UPI000D6E5E57|nr:GNAT family N-acetyltransferase [Reichenbachiella versicolor]
MNSIQGISPEETWPIRHKVMWSDKPFDYVKVPNDQIGEHFGLFRESKLVSIISLFFVGNEMQFRKFATLVECQGQGFGTELLNYVFEMAESRNVRRVWCNARVDKTEYYKRFGMQETEETFEKGGIGYVVMEKI